MPVTNVTPETTSPESLLSLVTNRSVPAAEVQAWMASAERLRRQVFRSETSDEAISRFGLPEFLSDTKDRQYRVVRVPRLTSVVLAIVLPT